MQIITHGSLTIFYFNGHWKYAANGYGERIYFGAVGISEISKRSPGEKTARIAWLSARNRGRQFNCLMRHINRETLVACFDELGGKKAVGVDGVTKEEYARDLSFYRGSLEGRKALIFRTSSKSRVSTRRGARRLTNRLIRAAIPRPHII